MADSLNQRLATSGGRRAFDREVAEMIRAQRFADAESVLMRGLGARRSPVADAVRASPVDAVRIAGWDELNAECDRLTREGLAITAIGLNLSNYNDGESDVWHDKEPAIEFSTYTDTAFPFSGASVDELLRVSAEPPTPWQGKMTGKGNTVVPSLSGLRALNSALLAHSEASSWGPRWSDRGAHVPPAPDEYVAFALGEWMLHLRFHQAVTRDVDSHGLALTVPVIVGEHDVGPFVRSVVMVRKLADHRQTSDRINQQRAAAHRANFDAVTEEFIADLREKRATIKGLGFFARAERRALIDLSEAREAQFLRIVGLEWPRPSWQMSDSEFEAFARAFRVARERWSAESTGAEGTR